MKARQGKNRRGTAGVAFDFRGLNEHSEPVFNAVLPNAVVFTQPVTVVFLCLARPPLSRRHH
ncbi:hypothetical protein DMX09_07675 [Pseudomonas protegens]|nr:hypothetical protein DMX09_07675 [Pseudomonas protegens]